MEQIKLLSLILFLAISPILAQNKDQNSDTNGTEYQMIFLTFHINNSDNGNVSIVFKKKTIAKGRIKGYNGDKEFNELGNITCSLLDKDLKVLETLYIENPLERTIEFVNDSGNLEKRIIIKKQTDFTVRMPYTKETIYLNFQLLSNTDNINPTTIKL